MPGPAIVRHRKTRDTRSSAPVAGASDGPGGDQAIVLRGLSWEQYVKINDAVVDPPNLQMIYCDGRLTLLTESRKHGWYAERLGELVKFLAQELGIPWEDSASATYRKKEKRGGVEGDKTFYFGKHAELMRGAVNIDLIKQPPPDLAIEMEVTHSADDAVIVWGRLGVAEIWRFDPVAWELGFGLRQDDGTYAPSDRSAAFPMLAADDVLDQMKNANEQGAGPWHAKLGAWARAKTRTRSGRTKRGARPRAKGP